MLQTNLKYYTFQTHNYSILLIKHRRKDYFWLRTLKQSLNTTIEALDDREN